MDPLSALAVASAVVQFVKFGIEVGKKLGEYSQLSPGEVPRPLVSINIRLPLLINALSRIQTESELEQYDIEIRSILHGVVLGCLKLVRELDDIATKIRPKAGESLASKLKKVFGSLKIEDRIEDIDLGLQGYISVLILHRVVDRTVAHTLPTEEVQYFEVKERLIERPISRDELIAKLDQCLFEAARGQKPIPDYVILLGDEGVGKSQLALTYCHQTHEVGQFQTVFWLDASTPNSLKLGLESAAAAVRRTKSGTSQEKLKFLNQFLTDRWHPWLVVLDNYQHKEFHSESITQLLPQKGNGAILITTRDYDMPPLGKVINVYKPLTVEDETNLRYDVTIALHRKELNTVKAAFERGLNVDRESRNVWGRDGVPLVNIAAEAGFDDGLQYLLDLGANPHLFKHMNTVLASAIHGGSLSTVTLYLDHEEEKGQQFDEEEYDRAFYGAMLQEDTAILKLLLQRRERNFRPDSRTVKDGFSTAAEKGNIDVIRLLLSSNKFTSDKRTRTNMICKAIDGKHLELTKLLLDEAGIDLDVLDSSSEVPLYHAVCIGRGDQEKELRDQFVKLLLEAGASPNIGSRGTNRMPLHQMAAYGCTSTISLLLQHGADVTLENEEHLTSLMMAVQWKTPASYPLLIDVEITHSDPAIEHNYFARPLMLAAESGDRELALPLLKKNKGIVDSISEESGDTPLTAAIRASQTSMARMLIRNKANQMIPNKQRKIAMILAAEKGLELVLRDLSKAPDSPGLEVQDSQGYTPIILAAKADHQKAVKVLLDLGADRDATNQFGETALDIAEEKDLEEMIKMLSTI